MIQILLTMPGYKNFDSRVVDYVGKKIPKDEMDFLSSRNESNNTIYVMPHEKSLLRTYFIQPNLEDNGNIREECIGKIFHASIDGKSFDYVINEDERDNEKPVKCSELSREQFEREYNNFINMIFGFGFARKH